VDISLILAENQEFSDTQLAETICGFEREINRCLRTGYRYGIKIQRDGKIFAKITGTQLGPPAGLRRDS